MISDTCTELAGCCGGISGSVGIQTFYKEEMVWLECSRTGYFDMLQTRISVVPPAFMSVRAIRSPDTGSFSVVAQYSSAGGGSSRWYTTRAIMVASVLGGMS